MCGDGGQVKPLCAICGNQITNCTGTASTLTPAASHTRANASLSCPKGLIRLRCPDRYQLAERTMLCMHQAAPDLDRNHAPFEIDRHEVHAPRRAAHRPIVEHRPPVTEARAQRVIDQLLAEQLRLGF